MTTLMISVTLLALAFVVGPLFALAANANINRYVDQELKTFAVAASTHIYKGALVGMNADGYCVPYTPGLPFLGVSYEEGDNSSGAAGVVSVRVYTQSDFEFTITGVAVTDAMRPVYATDDATLTLTPQDCADPIGRVVHYLAANKALVRIQSAPNIPSDQIRSQIELDCETGATPSSGILIPANLNEAGMVIEVAYALVTEVFAGGDEDQGVITLKDTDDTTLNVTFTPTNAGADAVGDIIQPGGSASTAIRGSTGGAAALVPAGKGVKAVVTTPTSGVGPAGKMRVFITARLSK